ncbi:MAG: hypothetical protein HQK58_09140 [Deltaproteobacteria bacterium]|nr:hypothetical protein [Deltaproteobacteria bacterium]
MTSYGLGTNIIRQLTLAGLFTCLLASGAQAWWNQELIRMDLTEVISRNRLIQAQAKMIIDDRPALGREMSFETLGRSRKPASSQVNSAIFYAAVNAFQQAMALPCDVTVENLYVQDRGQSSRDVVRVRRSAYLMPDYKVIKATRLPDGELEVQLKGKICFAQTGRQSPSLIPPDQLNDIFHQFKEEAGYDGQLTKMLVSGLAGAYQIGAHDFPELMMETAGGLAGAMKDEWTVRWHLVRRAFSNTSDFNSIEGDRP